jgi:hypothetical protein
VTFISRALTVAICACLAATMIVSVAANEDPKSPFILNIAPSQNAIQQPGVPIWKSGAPVFFILTMKNESDDVLHFNLTNSAFNYRTTVIDSQGRPVPETENFRKMKENDRPQFRHNIRNILVTLKPQETCQDTIEVSYLYDLSKPGKYMVRVERKLPPELGEGIVKSNIVKISIVE